tara:strand:- start:16147 stop:16296 length:150 start_codon:yes stop_codon:yes gene_type:complete
VTDCKPAADGVESGSSPDLPAGVLLGYVSCDLLEIVPGDAGDVKKMEEE